MASKKTTLSNNNQRLLVIIIVSVLVGAAGSLLYQRAFAGTSAKELCHRAGGDWHKGIGCFVNGELVDI